MRTRLLRTIALLVLATPVAAEDAPPVPEPPVPAELLGVGVVYHTLSGREAQVNFTSDAPIEDIVGKTNAVVGYAVAAAGSTPAPLLGGEWLLPVQSLATGIPLRDEHMAGNEWLDAQRFPVIRFRLTTVEDLKSLKEGDGFSTWSATLVGELTMHGETRPLRIPDSRLSFVKASERTASIASGDLLLIKCAYTVKLSDFGIRHKDVPAKVSDEITLSQLLRMSTAGN